MKMEVLSNGLTVEDAIANGLNELSAKRDECDIEIIEEPKKSLFGKNKPAIVKVEIREKLEKKTKLDVALSYLKEIMTAMHLPNVEIKHREHKDGVNIEFIGDNISCIIGHHGETLDALQYLVALRINRVDNDFYRISLDCGNYRKKREKTLEELAKRVCDKVKSTGKSQSLEAMNPYERRIIHSAISSIEGVFSKSKGDEPNRRVVIFSNNIVKKNNIKNSIKEEKKEMYVHKPEITMEEILKGNFKDKTENIDLNEKIEL